PAPIVTALSLMKLRAGREHERGRTIIDRQVQHLVRLVDDLLDVSRITRGKVALRRAPVELADAVWHAVEAATPLVVEHSHRLNVDVPTGIIVDADFDRLSQVIANLLTNAAKYTQDRGEIEIVARAE